MSKLISLYLSSIIVLFAVSCDTEVKRDTELKNYKYLALGDSYTIGTAIGAENAYPSLLKDSLEAGMPWNIQLETIAQNGWTTADLIQGIRQKKPDHDFDLVSLLIGVNNQYQSLSKALYKQEFIELVDSARAFASDDFSKLLIISIPDYGVTPAASQNKESIGLSIDDFNRINKDVADSLSIRYVELTEISRTALGKTDLIADDGLHFSGKMHHLWLDAIYIKAIKIMNGQ